MAEHGTSSGGYLFQGRKYKLAEGIPITEVSRWLGHKSIEVTHQIYGHLIPSFFDRARTALDAACQNRRQPPRNAPACQEA